jgi:IS30 family transposase
MSYQHLSIEEREVLARLSLVGVSRAEIARELGRARSTVCRELRRNLEGAEYLAHRAQLRAQRRRRQAKSPRKLGYEPLQRYVREKLALAWSPEQISGRVPVDFPRDRRMRISHETIYGWVWADKRQGGGLWQNLRQSRRKKRKRGTGRELRGSIPGRVGIEERPAIVETRGRFGDWESDTLTGSRQRGAVATHVERKSGYVVGARLPDKKAPTFTRRTVRAFRADPGLPLKTVTADNGKEFADFKKMEAELGVSVYFARPYHSWERGLNENTNGLVRQFLPKHLDLRKVSKRKLDKIFGLLNNRPRKRLGYRSPAEVIPRCRAVALQI